VADLPGDQHSRRERERLLVPSGDVPAARGSNLAAYGSRPRLKGASDLGRIFADVIDGDALARMTELKIPSALPVMFLYLGRRGALGRFTLELAEAAAGFETVDATIAISKSNEISGKFTRFGDRLLALNTFERAGPLAFFANFVDTRAKILAHIKRRRPVAVITLMPHVWTPLLVASIRSLGVAYATVIHDAGPHPGDPTAILTRWLVREARQADLIVTLSRTVADRLVSTGQVPIERVFPLFHPDLRFGGTFVNRKRAPGTPLRLLFLGRILKYKGLPLLIDAIEMLRRDGIRVNLGVAGAGDITKEQPRLTALGAEIINRWLNDDEIPALLARYEAIALSHTEASQSGVAATAFGNCMPVVGMPVGGIAEQVIDGRTGVLAHRINAKSFADAIHRLAADQNLYSQISTYLSETVEDRSMARFVKEITSEAAGLAQPTRFQRHV
jgi:glycosyltransferase involved in cell wall biosynthesis